jgi:hypothetical protein
METYIQETDQITENGTSENTTTGSRSNTQQPDEASSSSVIQDILTSTENDKDTDTTSVDTRQDKSTDSTHPTIQDDNTTTGSTTKERAERILCKRVMPMIPPARREWRTITTSIEIGTPRSIVWSPENWKDLSADDRLTAWQFAAMSVEYNLGVKSVTNKSDLLDKYAMLALPGTSLDMTSHTNGISQARLLNFNILKGIYMGNMKETEANVWLATLEAATAVSSKDTEGLLQVIKDVPLRLTLENSASNIST